MTKHYPKSRTTINQQQQQEQQEQHNPKEKGWYCLAHSVRWLCDICGNENKKIGEIKYYFVSGLN